MSVNNQDLVLNEMRAALALLETEMRTIGWWQSQAPPVEALNSKEPFCIDYLRFSEWLQWVYIPKMQAFMNQTGRLPAQSNLLAIAEEAWKGSDRDSTGLLQIIELLDTLVMGDAKDKWQAVIGQRLS